MIHHANIIQNILSNSMNLIFIGLAGFYLIKCKVIE
jgi:hypothetical protein